MPSKHERRHSTALLIGIVGLAYWFLVRPWHLCWGASDEEATGTLPGDGILRTPESQVMERKMLLGVKERGEAMAEETGRN